MGTSASISGIEAPALRLVGAGPGSNAAEARRAVALENHRAAALDELDPRWEFAREVLHAVEGGRAAILRPDRRRQLVASAVGKGLRPFDANLVIAIVQDAARRGEGLEEPGSRARLALVPAAEERASPALRLAVAAVGVGVVVFAALVSWLAGG